MTSELKGIALPDGARMVTASLNGVHLWGGLDGAVAPWRAGRPDDEVVGAVVLLAELTGHVRIVNCAACSPCDRFIASGGCGVTTPSAGYSPVCVWAVAALPTTPPHLSTAPACCTVHTFLSGHLLNSAPAPCPAS